MIMNGSALIHDWILVDQNTTSLFPDLNGATSEEPSGTSGGGESPSPTGAAVGLRAEKSVLALVAVLGGTLLLV